MTMIPAAPTDDRTDARERIEAHCRVLVAAGLARWHSDDAGEIELHLESGEAYRFGELGVTRLR